MRPIRAVTMVGLLCLAAVGQAGGAGQPAQAPPELLLRPTIQQAAALLVARVPGGARVAVGPGMGDSLLDGYVACMLAAALRQGGVEADWRDRLPRGQGPLPAGTVPQCFKASLHSRGYRMLLWCATSTEPGRRLLQTDLFDLNGPAAGASYSLRMPFHLEEDLTALVSGAGARLGAQDAGWFELFERIFPSGGSGQSDEAAYFFKVGLWDLAARGYGPDPTATPDRGFFRGIMALQLAGSRAQAEQVLGEALTHFPDSGPLYALRGWLALREGRPADAVIWLEQARLADMPRRGLYRYARALVALEQGEREAARQALEQAAREAPQQWLVLRELGRFYRQVDLTRAVDAYRRAVQLPDCPPQVLEELGVVLEAAGQVGEAIRVLQEALQADPSRLAVAQHLVRLLRRTAQHERALQLLRRAADANPCRPQFHAAHGDLALAMGKFEEARAAYEQALSVEPQDPYTTTALAALLARQRHYGQARRMLNDLLATRPDYAPARIELGSILAETGRFDEAVAELTEAAKQPQWEADAHLALAAAYLAAGRPDQAVQHAQLAVFSRPDAHAFSVLSQSFLSAGRTDQAETAAQSALDKDPFSAEAHLAMARVRLAQGRTDEAGDLAQEALRLDPYNVEALAFEARLLRDAGEYARCAERFSAALALDPWNAELHYELAEVLGKRLGRWEEATEHYRRFTELEKLRAEAAR